MNSILILDYPIATYGVRMFVFDFFPNIQILHAANLEEAIEQISNNVICLVIMDIHHPIHRDMEIINALRSVQKDIRILVFTSQNKKAHATTYLNAGVNGFLCKNSSEEEYQATIDGMMGGDLCLFPEKPE